MNKVVRRAGIMLVLVLFLAGGMGVFIADYLKNSGDWVMEAGSPHVYTDYSSVSGITTDRWGALLMDTSDGRDYTDNALLRRSVIHWLGDREGNIHAPIISYYAAKMTRHDVVNGLYVYGNHGGRITLTLSAKAQSAALEAMGTSKGTVAVYNYRTGELLCAVTTPTFDPDDLPDIAGDTQGVYTGAYINRFLKSTYTPGSVFKIVTLAAALETIDDIEEQSFECTGSVSYGIDTVTCMKAHGKQTLREAFRNSCNCAFASIADQLGGETLQRYAEGMGVTSSVSFDGVTSAVGSICAAGEADVMVAWSAIGQHKDLINPCSFLTMVGAIAGGGSGAVPYIVESIDGGSWGRYEAATQYTQQLISPETAAALREMMRYNVESYYGDENFPGLTVCAKSGTAEVGSGNNALFTGFVTDDAYPLAFIVVVEDGEYGRTTCIPILTEVLAACKEVLDNE